jgi:thiol-disulfide isomerase/thioredoxin
MKRTILSLLTAAGLFAAVTVFAADPAAPEPTVPRKAPELSIQMPGKQIQLSQFKGYVCVLAFMSTECPHCQHLATVLSMMQQEYAPKGVQMLGVVFNAEATTNLPNFAKTYARGMFPIGMSTEPVVKAFVEHPPGIPYIPMIDFIDKNGVIRGQHLGANDSHFFDENVEVQNIRAELDKIFKDPVIQLPGAKKK